MPGGKVTAGPARIGPQGGAGRALDVPALVEAARQGRPLAVARLISMVEDGRPELREVTAALMPHAAPSRVIGLTGPPGVGKSTLTGVLVGAFRARGERVGVLAVDPSSPFSGGALLGDRVRLADHALDPEVFIRSMASRGHLGGLSRATPQALRVLQAAGCGVVLVETVGVGQSEVEVAGLADTTLVLLAPGMGDGIQAAKAGILEIGDVFVVNKADRDGAAATARDLRHMVGWSDPDLGSAPARAGGPGGSTVRPAGWRPPVVRTVASTGFGSTELMAALDGHLTWLSGGGGLADRRRRRAAVEIEALVLAGLRSRLGELGRSEHLDTLAEDVVAGRADPYRAADRLIEALTG